jgi:isopenicillin-N N-acyltransferase like protein
VSAFVLASAAGTASGAAMKPDAHALDGIMSAIVLRGSAFDIGVQHGRALRRQIQQRVEGQYAEISAFRHTPLPLSELRALIALHAERIEQETPHLATELRGLAEGAAVPYEQAVLLQLHREAIGWDACPGECTTIAFQNSGDHSFIAQNIDLDRGLRPFACVLRIQDPDADGGEVLMLSFAGLLGFAGINEAGVGIGINYVNAQPWQPGVSPYLLVRHLLRARSSADCLAELRRVTRSSSRCLTIRDRSDQVMVELTATDMRILRGARLWHTNHFLHGDFVPLDRMNIFSRQGSRLRLNTVAELSAGLDDEMHPEKIFDVLSDHSHFPVGLCAHNDGDSRREETVASVILSPARGQVFLRSGNPCCTPTQRYDLTWRRAVTCGEICS